jgi:hypothetical protein
MQNRHPPRPVPQVPDFTPVPRKYRCDGWTPERQRAFIVALAETGSVKHAAKRINMSPEGAYYLRRQPGAEEFNAAWAAALDLGVQRLADIALERAIDGVPVPVFWKGEQVGERRRYNDRLLMFILRNRMPETFADGRALPAPGAGAGAGADATATRDTLDAAERDALHDEWEAERREKERAEMPAVAEIIRRNLDFYRLHFIKACEKDPDRRAAWELLAGPTDWQKVAEAQTVDDDFGFARQNQTWPSTILVLAGLDSVFLALDHVIAHSPPAAAEGLLSADEAMERGEGPEGIGLE